MIRPPNRPNADQQCTVRQDTPEKLHADPDWTPVYSRWRHGGWYVHNVRYPQNGACACVSKNYPDSKWRIVCDDRRKELGGQGDFTFPSRDAAARAEYALVTALTIQPKTAPIQDKLVLDDSNEL